jgi:hemerythrin-like domain-containing protein
MLRDPSLVPLSHQHQHALALCVQIDRRLASATANDRVPELAAVVVQQFDSEMRHHFNAEELVLFPVLAKFDATTDLVRSLLAEHRTMEALRDVVNESCDTDAIARFSEVLRLHVRKEEGLLFEEAQRLLSPEQLADLGNRLAAAL